MLQDALMNHKIRMLLAGPNRAHTQYLPHVFSTVINLWSAQSQYNACTHINSACLQLSVTPKQKKKFLTPADMRPHPAQHCTYSAKMSPLKCFLIDEKNNFWVIEWFIIIVIFIQESFWFAGYNTQISAAEQRQILKRCKN